MQELLDLWDASGATDKDNVMDFILPKPGIPQCLLNWLQRATEQIIIEIFKAGPCDAGVEVNTLKERVNLNVGLGTSR